MCRNCGHDGLRHKNGEINNEGIFMGTIIMPIIFGATISGCILALIQLIFYM